MQTVNLDISVKSEISYIYAKQGDVGRKFKVILSDNGEDYPVPDGTVVSVWYSGSSGAGNYTSIDEKSAVKIEGNVLTVEMIAQMLTNHGGGSLCLALHGTGGSQLGTWDLVYLVEQVPGADSDPSQMYYTAFAEDVRAARDAAQKAQEAADKLDILAMYPVGSIYMSVSEVSPADMFGGVWEQIKDVFLLACGDGYGSGTTGGAAVTAHNHAVPVGIGGGYIYADAKNGSAPIETEAGSAYAVATTAGEITITNRSVSDLTYLDNMPPYLAVYMWKRVQ